MALPWLRIVDAVLGLSDVARNLNRRSIGSAGDPGEQLTTTQGTSGTLEARLAGVVVAALKEAFDRDHQRLQLEREQIELERKRTERLLRFDLARQAGDREIGRLRQLAAVAVVSWLATLFLSSTLVGGGQDARLALGAGWVLLLAALAASFLAQSRVAASLARLSRIDEQLGDPIMPSAGPAGAITPWLVVAGLGMIGVAVLIR